MTRRDVAALVVRRAVENPQWGYTRIRGALLEPRPRDRSDHGEADPARPRDRPGSRAEPAHALEDVPAGALGGPHGLRSVHRRGAHAGRAPAVPGLLRDCAAVPPRDHRRDPSAAVRQVDGADGPQCDGPGRWLLATRPLSDSRPRPALHAGFWRDPGGGVSSRSVSRRRVPISTRMPSGSSALFKRSVSVASSPSAKSTCVSSWARTSTTTIASETTRDSTTRSCNDRHRR